MSERFLGLDDRQADPEKARVVLLPVPYERTSSYGSGSAAGPAAILRASREVELFDTELGVEPWRSAGGIATLRPLPVEEAEDGAVVMETLDRAVTDWLERGRMVVTLAGEHTGVVGAIRAHARASNGLTVVQIDAHSDMRPDYLDDPWNHACAMARVADFHGDIVQVGIRSESLEDRALVQEHGLPVFRAAGIHQDCARGLDWIKPIIEACEEEVYVTLDCDAFDPSVMPSTGTPEPGGLTWQQVNELLCRLCRTRRVVGFDVNELAPIPGLNHPQFTVAKLIARFMGWMGSPDGLASAVDKVRLAVPCVGESARGPESRS